MKKIVRIGRGVKARQTAEDQRDKIIPSSVMRRRPRAFGFSMMMASKS